MYAAVTDELGGNSLIQASLITIFAPAFEAATKFIANEKVIRNFSTISTFKPTLTVKEFLR
jgi:hypothetical protein